MLLYVLYSANVVASVCVMSIVRLVQTQILYSSSDATWNLLQISIWS